ncbi:MAG: class I SAM-dependent methyltransferase [Clostridia bacterium]|nr:class I SAM-dependent methyltransferase [Clostridia bacterium]
MKAILFITKNYYLIKFGMIQAMNFHPMPRYLMRKNAIIKIIKKFSYNNKKLLEIGYGAGEIFSTYLQLGIKCYGYDFSEEAYKYTSKNFDSTVALYKKEDDIQKFDFDFVVACEVLEHIENEEQALLNWKSYLKKNGVLIISVPAHQNRWDDNDISSGHFRRYEKNKLKELLNKWGYQVEMFYTYDFPSCFVLDPIRSNRAKKMHLSNKSTCINKEEFTKISGIARDENKIFKFFSNKYFWHPLIKFQELFYKSNLGSAYIVACTQKMND